MDAETFREECAGYIMECINLIHERRPFRGLTVPIRWEIDHVCYKCTSNESYQEMFGMLSAGCASEYNTSFISGRKISTMLFAEPILAFNHAIRVLELSDQKPDGSQKEGFNHIEILPEKLICLSSYGTKEIVSGDFRVKIASMRLIDKIRQEQQLSR